MIGLHSLIGLLANVLYLKLNSWLSLNLKLFYYFRGYLSVQIVYVDLLLILNLYVILNHLLVLLQVTQSLLNSLSVYFVLRQRLNYLFLFTFVARLIFIILLFFIQTLIIFFVILLRRGLWLNKIILTLIINFTSHLLSPQLLIICFICILCLLLLYRLFSLLTILTFWISFFLLHLSVL